MEMQIKEVTLRILTAAEGKVLTNGEAYSSVGGDVYLGAEDSPENWTEIEESEVPE